MWHLFLLLLLQFCWLSFNVYIDLCVWRFLRFFLSLFISCAIAHHLSPLALQTHLWSHICNLLHVFIHIECVHIYLFPMNKSIRKEKKRVYLIDAVVCDCVYFCLFVCFGFIFAIVFFPSASSLIQMRFPVFVCERMWMVSIEFFVNFGHRSHTQ